MNFKNKTFQPLNYGDFGYPTLLHLIPSAIEDNLLRDAVDQHKDALVSFITKKPNHDNKKMVMGSGFFINSNDPTVAVVMTAAHVLKDFERYGHGWITVGTTMIKIGSIGVQRFDEKRDFAIWEIPSSYLIEQGLENIVTFPIVDQETQMQVFEPTCSFAIFGYPSSKNNTIDSRDQHKSGRKIIGIALHGYGFDSELLELGFFYSGKSTPESWSNHITTPPALNGMSGSPCVRFVVHKKLKRPMLIVAGIFTSLLGKKELRAVALKSPWLPESSFRAHS